jgi:hypothetical protein
MHSKARLKIGLLLILPSVLLAAWGVIARGKKQPDVYVQSIQFAPVTLREARKGFDTKVSVTVVASSFHPRLNNRAYVGGNIESRDARLIQVSADSKQTIAKQKPSVHVSIGPTNVVSFLFNKSKLAKSKIILRATIKEVFAYNAYPPAVRSPKVEFHTSTGVPIEVPIH